MSDASLVALTGGSGFVGRHLVARLAAAGWRVRMLVRSLPVHEQLAPHRLELVGGDVHNAAALAQLCRGANVIIHIAGAIKGDRQSLMRTNGEGTARIVRAWRQQAPAARFVLVSSLTAREPQLSAYGASKQAAEAALRQAGENWLIVRPAAVYGPWDRETLSIFKAARWPVQPMLNGASARLAMVHVHDVAAALAALAANGPGQQIFELGDSAPAGYSWPQMLAVACRAVGQKARPLRLPPALVRGAAALNDAMARRRGQVSIFSPGKAREILHKDWTIAPQRRVPPSLWQPVIGMEEGFAQTARWYRERGWL